MESILQWRFFFLVGVKQLCGKFQSELLILQRYNKHKKRPRTMLIIINFLSSNVIKYSHINMEKKNRFVN